MTHGGGEELAGLELLQSHGAGVGAEEQDEGHEGDVWDEFTGVAHQLSFVLQAVRPREGRPCGVHGLHREDKECFGAKPMLMSVPWYLSGKTLQGRDLKYCSLSVTMAAAYGG